MRLKSIKEVKNLRGKRVLVRVDFNVPVRKGKVKDAYKIEQSLPTIRFLLEKGARVILVSHLGRPSGYSKEFSLAPVQKELEKMLGKTIQLEKIKKLEDLKIAQKAIQQYNNTTIVLLDNIRFLPGEEKNDPKLAKALAGLADVFVLDGFAVAHRDAASVSGVAKYLPSYTGLLLAKEVEMLSHAVENPRHPLVVILGGAKVETKIPVLKHLLSTADYILVGGGIVNTYLWAKGYKVGGSLVGKKFKKEVLRYCVKKKVILPVDVVVGDERGKRAEIVPIGKGFKIKDAKLAIYDIGPATSLLFAEYIKQADTLIWNGALGVFEQHPYEYGTYSIARLFAARSKGKAFGVAGGGETVEVLQKLGVAQDVDFVSTGGGAMIDYLAGVNLPGIKALMK